MSCPNHEDAALGQKKLIVFEILIICFVKIQMSKIKNST